MAPEKKEKKNKSTAESLADSYRDAAPYLGLGVQLAASVLIMLFAGYKLDEYFETSPLLTILFAFLGAGAGLYHVIRSAGDINKKKNEKK